MRQAYLLLLTIILSACNQPQESPTVLRNFTYPATSDEVREFCKKTARSSRYLRYEVFGKTDAGNDLVLIRATSKQKEVKPKLRVLVFAQQHGNEISGKEALLILIRDIANGSLAHLTEHMELWIIPQINPDGGDRNERRNANGIDLNRDHVILQASETRALHDLFHRINPHVTVDIHEYQPFRTSWEEFGGFKNFDVQVGIPTNLNVSEEIRSFAHDRILPEIEKHLDRKGFSFHNYIVGPVPTEGRTRHSTVDIDDGRQSFAILNTLSLIYEGINGRDGFIESLERRTYGQYEAILAFLRFLHENADQTITLVENARQKLRSSIPGESVAIRMEHFHGGSSLSLPLTSSRTGNDTLVIVNNYHPVVSSTLNVKRPTGYLVPADDTLLVKLLEAHRVEFKKDFSTQNFRVKEYYVNRIMMSEDEELENRFPEVTINERIAGGLHADHLFIPINQLHSNFLVSLFEPQSMLGLAQRNGFEYLLKENEVFPVLRVE
jgi:hypothetical protein